jgi:hypothetical protein
VRAKIAAWHLREETFRDSPKWLGRTQQYLNLAQQHLHAAENALHEQAMGRRCIDLGGATDNTGLHRAGNYRPGADKVIHVMIRRCSFMVR